MEVSEDQLLIIIGKQTVMIELLERQNIGLLAQEAKRNGTKSKKQTTTATETVAP